MPAETEGLCFMDMCLCVCVCVRVCKYIYIYIYIERREWKCRTNRKLEKMSKGENIIKWLIWQRISWLSHLERTEEERMPREIFTQELEEKGRREDPGKDGKLKQKEIFKYWE